MFEQLALVFFILKITFQLGVVVLIWRYASRDTTDRYRPGVGVFAMSMAGSLTCASIQFLRMAYRDNFVFDFTSEAMQLVSVSFLFLAVWQLGGNVAMLTRPFINAWLIVKGAYKGLTNVRH